MELFPLVQPSIQFCKLNTYFAAQVKVVHIWFFGGLNKSPQPGYPTCKLFWLQKVAEISYSLKHFGCRLPFNAIFQREIINDPCEGFGPKNGWKLPSLKKVFHQMKTTSKTFRAITFSATFLSQNILQVQ